MKYFDHCASTPPFDEVVDTVAEAMRSYYANPSSLHTQGLRADRLLEKAREQIGELLRLPPKRIVFTSGGTESNVLAIRGTAERFQGRGKHIVVSPYEHASVIETMAGLGRRGFEVTRLPGSPDGLVRASDVEAALRDDTILVSVMHVNNEVGSVQPIEAIGRMLRRYPKILFHVDAVQSIGKLPVNAAEWGIDLLSGSAHKFRGPRGAGLLYVREGVELMSVQTGGGQEFGLRSGTPNVPAIVGMAKALRLYVERERPRLSELSALRDDLSRWLGEQPGIELNSGTDPANNAPHIVHFSVPGIRAEVMLHALEQQDLLVSTRSACSSGDESPNPVLLAMGRSEASAKSGIRICFGSEHTLEDVALLKRGIENALHRLGGVAR